MTIPTGGLGQVLAIGVLILCVVLAVVGQVPILLAGLIGAVALARLV